VVVVSEHDYWTGFRPDHIDRIAAGGATEIEEWGTTGSM
jgi:glutaredoxin-like protein NrdH